MDEEIESASNLLKRLIIVASVISILNIGGEIYQSYKDYRQDKKEEAYWNEVRGSLKESSQDTMERLYRRHLDQLSSH